MRKLVLSAVIVVLGLWAFPRNAAAATFFVDFCPGDPTCPAGITEASLSFDEILGTVDPNDYDLTVTITGDATAPALLDEILVKVSGINTNEYEFLPTLGSAPAGATWGVFFDNLPQCGDAPLSGQSFCAQSSGNGVNQISTSNVFEFLVDFDDDAGVLGSSSTVNLRAQFLNADGSNAGILSPGGGTFEDTPPDGSEEDVITPEPTMLTLLGGGLVLAARRLRRRK